MSESNDKKPEPTALQVDWTSEPAPVYANEAHVAHTVREFSVIFDDAAGFPGRNAPAHDPTAVRSRIVASIRFAPDAYFRILCALASSWNRFAQQYLEGTRTRPRFKLIDAGDAQLEGVER